MMKLELNHNFLANIETICGTTGKIWLSHLPQVIQDYAKRWHFEFIAPMPNLSYSFVGHVKYKHTALPAKQFAIIKIVPPQFNLVPEIEWLQTIQRATPEVYAADKDNGILLMELLSPGQPLSSMVANGQDDEATRLICHIIRELQTKQPKTSYPFKPLSELANDLECLNGIFNAALLTKAKTLFHDLTQDASHEMLLHGDLHHDNILSAGNEWKVIDPHGYRGDPVAEVGAMFRNPPENFPTEQPLAKVIARRLAIMHDELNFDPKRIQAWAFCITVLSIAWTYKDHGAIPTFDTEVAVAIDRYHD